MVFPGIILVIGSFAGKHAKKCAAARDFLEFDLYRGLLRD